MTVSIIIVSYNTENLLRNCISSIYKNIVGVDFEVIVSDNGSTDGSIEMIRAEFPQVILIENNKNLGFGKANNIGAKIAKGKYLFFLNSDTVLFNDAVKGFYEAAKNEECILGAYLCDGHGAVVPSYGKFLQPILFSLKKNIYDFYPMVLKKRRSMLNAATSKNTNDERYVDFVTGADLFISKKNFNAINGFDGGFFMYFEDEDLCRRELEIGIKSKIIATPKIAHLEGASSSVKIKKILIQDESFFYYVGKHYGCLKCLCIFLAFWILFPIRLFSKSLTAKEKVQMLKFNITETQKKLFSQLRRYYETKS